MNNNFISDFSLFPIQKLGNPRWEYRKATWPAEIEPEVHKLYNDEIPGPLYYNRLKLRDGTMERCKICKCGDDIHVEPGNGFDYLVKRVSTHNKLDHGSNQDPNQDVPHEMKCDVCLDNKKTHVMLDCNHVCLCESCSVQIYNSTKLCPICNTPMTKPALKLIFS